MIFGERVVWNNGFLGQPADGRGGWRREHPRSVNLSREPDLPAACRLSHDSAE